MKNILHITIITLLIIGVLTFISCLLPATTLLWTSYGLCVLSIILFAVLAGSIIMCKKQNYILRLPFLQLWLYPVLVLLSTGFFVICEAAGLFSLPIIWLCLIEFIILAVFVIIFVVINFAKSTIQAVDNSPAQKQYNMWKLLVIDVEAMVASASDGDRRMISELADAFRYSDPVTPPELAALDNEISGALAALKGAVMHKNSEQIKISVEGIKGLIASRNEKIKIFK